MSEKYLDKPVADENTDAAEAEILPDQDLEVVAGGGTFGDIYDALNESWTDIKKGFSDAWND